MKKLFVILSCVATMLFAADANATKQTTVPVKGSIVDQAGSPVGFATVSIEKSDSTVIAATSADKDGLFSLTSTSGKYTLAVRLLGYKDFSMPLNVASSAINLDPIVLVEDTQMLASATVTEKVKLIEMKVDKLVMNVSQSAFAQGSNALDLIKKAPGVTIDKDGNVTLNGSAVSVWIDGRPSYLSGKSLEALLRSTDGTTIDKFEIMAHPSAKYDAAGQGGIINIKTKKNALEGLNGNVGIDGGGMYFGDIDKFLYNQSVWANLNYKAGKGRTFVNLYQASQTIDQLETVSNILEGEGYTFGQQSSSLLELSTNSYQAKVGHDYFKDSKNTFGFIATLPAGKSGFGTDRANSWAKQTMNSDVIKYSETDIDQVSKDLQASMNLNYTHVFDPMKAKEITINADYYYMTTDDANSQLTFSRVPQVSDWTQSTRTVDTDRDIRIYSAKADYQSLVFSKYMFEAGAKWALSQTNNMMAHKETGDNIYDQKTLFDYNEHIAAAYVDIAGTFAKKFSAKFGLRAEYTNSLGDWTSIGEKTKKSYLDIFPTAYVGYGGEKARYTFSYTRRIGRPSYDRLNPTKTYVDANNYVVGNPEITPQYTNVIALQAGYGQHFSVTALYNGVQDYIMQNPSFDESGNEIFTWGNFGAMNMSGLSANITELPIFKWLTWTLSGSALYTWNKANDGNYTSRDPMFQAYTCLTALLPKDWKIQVDGTYQSSVAAAYLKTSPTVYYTLAVKKNLLKDKLILSVNVDDMFRTLTSDISVNNLPGVKESIIGQTPYRQSIKIGLDWNFGKATRIKARNVGNLEEVERTGSSSKAGVN